MKRSPTLRWPSLFVLVLAIALAGCGDDAPTEPVPQAPADSLPPGTPLNDTPANTLTRLEAAYETEALGAYVALLSADFRFEFSSEADPDLATLYGNSWGRSRDSASTAHLFGGFTNSEGAFAPGATAINLSLPGTQITGDPEHPDSAAYYMIAVVPQVSLLLDVPWTDGYSITGPHNFHLVRGDAAVLRAGQPADPTRWYVHRQRDLSPFLGVRAPRGHTPARTGAAVPATWGSVKATYVDLPGDPPGPRPPLNDTPVNTMIRFVNLYEHQLLVGYQALLTEDFRFTFSNISDPDLVARYGNSWSKDHEAESTFHLFDGFTNQDGAYLPGATSITLSLTGMHIIDDPFRPDSGAYYKFVIVPEVQLRLEVPGTNGFEISGSQNFYLVRGDAAVLGSLQRADATRWYLRRHADMSTGSELRVPGAFVPARILPASPSSWGRVKAMYHL